MPGTGPRAKSTCIEAVVRDRLEAPHPYDRKDNCYSACDTGSPAGQLWFSMLTLLTPTGPYKGGWRDPPPLCLNRTADSKPATQQLLKGPHWLQWSLSHGCSAGGVLRSIWAFFPGNQFRCHALSAHYRSSHRFMVTPA